MSLRSRLALLAAFAIVALLVALFVAWRLARATESFALRQADASVRAAARDLAHELQTHPQGYQTIEQALPAAPDRPRGKDPHAPGERERRVPPHIETLFAAYSDPLARLTAITLHRFPDVAGGFCRSDGVIVGFASGTNSAENVPVALAETIRALASQTASSGSPAASTTQSGSDRILLVVYPGQDNLGTAWAMQRLSPLAGLSDWPNVAALLALALSTIAVSGLALITVRDLRSGVLGIEAGLAGLTTDLNRQLPLPETLELARIATAINELAATLRANIARQTELKQELAQRERLSALGRVIAGVAHEVRNPLAAIKLKVQLARRSGYAPEKLDATFNVVTAEIDRLDTLVRRLLEFGGQQRLDRRAVDLGALATSRAAFFMDLAAHTGVVIDTNRVTASPVVTGDEARLSQVADNIIQNALDAMPEGGRLTIVCDTFNTPDGSAFARLRFTDTGRGIPPEDQKHIFEPFHTGRDTGTGLGLAIARAIIEEHAGRLSFVSDADVGTSFVLELPLATCHT